MADSHGAAYNHSPEVNSQSGNLDWQQADGGNGFVGIGGMESRPDGDGDTDDIGSYAPIASNMDRRGQLTERQVGYSDGGWS